MRMDAMDTTTKGHTMTTKPTITDTILANARRDRDNPQNDWPGTPLTQLPLMFRDDLHALVKKRRVFIVERPSATELKRTAVFVVPASFSGVEW